MKEENKDDVVMTEIGNEGNNADEKAKKEKMDDYEKLQSVLQIAENDLSILVDTRDY